MAINLLGNIAPKQYSSLQPKTTTYGSLSTPSTQYASLVPKTQNLSVASPTNSSIMGVKAVSPTTNVQAPASTLPKAQVQQVVSKPVQGDSLGNTQGMTPEQMKAAGADTLDQTRYNEDGTKKAPATPAPTYSGILGQLVQGASQPSEDYLRQQAQASQYNDLLRQSRENQAQSIANIQGAPHTMNFAQGAENVIRNQYLQEQNALGSAYQGASNLVGAANTQQQTRQAGLLGAAGYAQPQLAGYNQQSFNPLTGQFSGGGSLDSVVAGIVEKVKNGTMTYADAQSALSGYGQGGTNALQQQLGPDFNVAQSNSLAGQQGTIKPAYDYAKLALSNLQNAVKGLATGQNTNVPIINSITQGLSSTFGVGSEAVQNYKAALAEARSAIQKVLASVQGGTPTDYVGQSAALLPDNATPNQINAAVSTLDTLGAAKVGIYGNPGTSGTTQNASSNSSNIYSW